MCAYVCVYVRVRTREYLELDNGPNPDEERQYSSPTPAGVQPIS